MEYFLSILKMIKLTIDLGYNTLQINKQILKKLPNIFVSLIMINQFESKLPKFKSDVEFDENLEEFK